LPKDDASISERAAHCSLDSGRSDCAREPKKDLKVLSMPLVSVMDWPSTTSFVHLVFILEVLKRRGWFSLNRRSLSWIVDRSCLALAMATNW
jgi:hypothetical protein